MRADLFYRACNEKTRVNGLQLRKSRLILDIRKYFITPRVVRHWNRPRKVMESPGGVLEASGSGAE